jgi:protoheme IX farnesyltransferase
MGLLYLALAVNWLAAVLGAFTLVSYVFIYTPLKRVTWLNTMVGAVPGAMPPLIGWAAARGELGRAGFVLFAIQALWQMPHFMAIAWIYREEYAKAGFKMLPVLDPDGHRTARHALIPALGLLPVSLCPFLFRLAGPTYLAGAVLLSTAFIWFALGFSRHLTVPRARQLFYVSILYLPLLLVVMVCDKAR